MGSVLPNRRLGPPGATGKPVSRQTAPLGGAKRMARTLKGDLRRGENPKPVFKSILGESPQILPPGYYFLKSPNIYHTLTPLQPLQPVQSLAPRPAGMRRPDQCATRKCVVHWFGGWSRTTSNIARSSLERSLNLSPPQAKTHLQCLLLLNCRLSRATTPSYARLASQRSGLTACRAARRSPTSR